MTRRRPRAHWTAAAVLLALAALLLAPALARADGDPGSDVLYQQNLFAGADAGLSIPQQVKLGKLLNATAGAGAPVRVAIIAKPDDLGTVTALWGHPQLYAEYLGAELSLVYTGRLLVVMPNGYGVLDYASDRDNAPSQLAKALAASQPPGDTAAALVAGATDAVYALEAAAGVDKTDLAHETSARSVLSTPAAPNPAAPAAKPKDSRPGAIFGVVVVLLLIAYVAWRRGWKPKLPDGLRRGARGERPRARIKPVALLPTALLLIVIAALVVNHVHGSSAQAVSDLANNPNLDPGTQLPVHPAPSFTLTDETGQKVSLSQYRGKVVVLSFVDAECQTICPLTTQAMLQAKQSLGAAGKDVQLLGIDANWKSTQIDDVLEYTQLHGLLGKWHFLTGSLAALNRVWSAYGLNEYELAEKDHADMSLINHVAATYIISPQGDERALYTTQSSYAAIPQLGQLIAQEVSRLLPSHPKIDTDYSYADVTGTPPSTATTLPRVGGGSVQLGPGHPHLYVFFDTWDTQTIPIAAELDGLNAYAREAKRLGLPTPIAVDEASVEPSAAALTAFLKSLPKPLDYPVVIDGSGKVADGYDVQGEPWFVLTDDSGSSTWYREVYTSTWPNNARLVAEARASLHPGSDSAPTDGQIEKELAGSPAPLAKLHSQAALALNGGIRALRSRIRALRGYPVVVNVWYSTCPPCQAEAGLFATAAARYGKRVAFLGADIQDTPSSAEQFMRQHDLSYPTYLTSETSLGALLPGGLEGTPTTIYISRTGKVVDAIAAQYDSGGALDTDIEDYALRDAG